MFQSQIPKKKEAAVTFEMGLVKPRVIFLGTPEFAVASLDALIRDGINVVAVVTAPDKPAGRGMKMNVSAVKEYAVSKNLPVLQPVKLKDPDFIEELRSFKADLQVVVAFRMLPEIVWNMPPMGSINLHGSLLPQYRGAAPINWAVINGEKVTGVTTFKLKHEIDTGDILLTDSFAIGEDETAGEVHDRMKDVGAALLVKTVRGILAGTLSETPQKHDGDESLRHAPKIFTETSLIDFTKSVEEVHNLIRGLSPFPGAFTHVGGKVLKIFRTFKEEGHVDQLPGQYETDGKSYIKFACRDGYVQVKELQLEGKKRMQVDEFLRGNRL